MNPGRNNTHGSGDSPEPFPTHPATIRAPRPSKGQQQQRDIHCAAYEQCLGHACGHETGIHWLRGFDCGRCPSAVRLETMDTTAKQHGSLNLTAFSLIVRDVTSDGPMAVSDISSVIGITSNHTRDKLQALEKIGLAKRAGRVPNKNGRGRRTLWTSTMGPC